MRGNFAAFASDKDQDNFQKQLDAKTLTLRTSFSQCINEKISFIVFYYFFSIGKAATIQVGANFPVKKIKASPCISKRW